MAFKASKYSARDVKYGLMDNSQTLSVGEVIIPGVQGDTAVVLTGGGTTGLLLGAVTGFKDKAGVSLEFNTYAAESDNVTDKLVQVSYVPLAIVPEWISDLDAAAETTDNSSAYGNFAVDSTGLLVDESTVVAFGTRTAVQLFSYGLTGKDTTQVTCTFFATVGGAQS